MVVCVGVPADAQRRPVRPQACLKAAAGVGKAGLPATVGAADFRRAPPQRIRLDLLGMNRMLGRIAHARAIGPERQRRKCQYSDSDDGESADHAGDASNLPSQRQCTKAWDAA
jgi:hypothetical protein